MLEMKNRVAHYISAKKSFEFRSEEISSAPSENYVLIKNKWVGICGSDLHTMELDYINEIVLGHEWVGEVIGIGKNVFDFKIGDHVTSANKIKCGECESCFQQMDDCKNVKWLTAHYGMLREYAHFPAISLIKVPNPVSKDSTLFEILAVAENVWLKSREKILNTQGKVLIMGAGLLGLSMALVLKRENVEFEMLEVIPSRILRANRLGFECHLLPQALMNSELKDSYPFIIEATGDHLGGTGGFKYLDHFGSQGFEAIILSKYIKDIPFKTFRFFTKQAQLSWIQGCTEHSLKLACNSWRDSIHELGNELITHEFAFDQVGEAFQTAQNRKVSGRVIVRF